MELLSDEDSVQYLFGQRFLTKQYRTAIPSTTAGNVSTDVRCSVSVGFPCTRSGLLINRRDAATTSRAAETDRKQPNDNRYRFLCFSRLRSIPPRIPSCIALDLIQRFACQIYLRTARPVSDNRSAQVLQLQRGPTTPLSLVQPTSPGTGNRFVSPIHSSLRHLAQ
jgi:hypothetical protein